MHAATLLTGAQEAPVPGKDAGHADEAEPDIPRGEARDVPDATGPGCPGEAKADASGGKAHDARGASGGGARRRSGARGNAGEAPGARVGEGNGAGGSGHPQALGRVLVIEDEPGIVDFLRRGLEEEGFAVEAAVDGAEGERLALSCDFDIVVLDLLLPGRGGLEVLAALRRARPRLPVVVLTARGELEDRVAGLDAGAVDYIVKPVSIVELAARLRAHLRVLADTSTTLRGAGIEVELLTRTVRRDGEPVSLSSTEFDLLAYMLRNQGEVLSREQLLCAVWGPEHGRETNVVDVYIGYLRRKLAAPGGVPPISTVRAVGYRFGETA